MNHEFILKFLRRVSRVNQGFILKFLRRGIKGESGVYF